MVLVVLICRYRIVDVGQLHTFLCDGYRMIGVMYSCMSFLLRTRCVRRNNHDEHISVERKLLPEGESFDLTLCLKSRTVVSLIVQGDVSCDAIALKKRCPDDLAGEGGTLLISFVFWTHKLMETFHAKDTTTQY